MAKLDSKHFRPFHIMALVGHAVYCLNISNLWKCKRKYNVFHESLLSPHHRPVFESSIAKPEIINREEVFEVEHILNSKKVGHSIHYLIKWCHYNHANNTWEPTANVNAQELVKEFHTHHPNKPQPSCL